MASRVGQRKAQTRESGNPSIGTEYGKDCRNGEDSGDGPELTSILILWVPRQWELHVKTWQHRASYYLGSF